MIVEGHPEKSGEASWARAQVHSEAQVYTETFSLTPHSRGGALLGSGDPIHPGWLHCQNALAATLSSGLGGSRGLIRRSEGGRTPWGRAISLWLWLRAGGCWLIWHDTESWNNVDQD